MATQYDVVVVGLGAMGAATLYQLSKRGVKVLGIDRFSPPHDQGSSHGATRITRVSVGEGQAYVPLVTNSHRIWRELEKETGMELFEQCGVLIMTSTDVDHPNDFTKHTIEIARNSGIEHEVLTAQETRKRFPQFGPIRDDAVCYLEPSGGYVRPERCIDAQVKMAKKLGADLKLSTVVTGVESKNGTVTITTDKNETIVAKKAIISAGMWNKELLGEPFNHLLKICRQKLYWYKLSDPSKFPKNSPSFILKHGSTLEDSNYGFPPIPGEGSIKIATHQFEVGTTPEELDRNISAAECDEMYKEHVEPFMAGVSPEIADSKVCTYTVTPDRGFIIDEHPKMKGVTIISACSGHGFKHSAGIGEAVARLHVDGSCGIDMTAFSVARFAQEKARL